MTSPVCAGIDAGQRFLDIGLAPSGQTFRLPNTAPAFELLLERLRRQGVQRVVLEAADTYAQPVVQALDSAGFAVGVVNPRRIKAFRDAEGKRAKTDRLDAGLIARFALVMTDAIRPLPSAEQRALKALATRRRQLTEMIAMEKTRLKQALEPTVIESHRAAIADLSRACDQVEAFIEDRLDQDPRRAEDRRILTSIPGIGPRVAQVLLTEMPELGTLDRKAIASLAGLAPHISQSGNAPPRAAIAGGRPCIRAALYMSALVAVRHDPKMKLAYRALRTSGKPAKVALTAIARRILVTANAMIKAKTLYNPLTNNT
jgi:transposase